MIENSIDIKTLNQQVAALQKDETGKTQSGEGVVLIKNVSKGLTSNGNPKYSGILANQEEGKFMVWNNSPAFDYLDEHDLVEGEAVVKIKYETSKYGVIIKTIEPVTGYNPDDFIKSKYNFKEIWADFRHALHASGLTAEGYELLKTILHNDTKDDIFKSLCCEYAALSHHDNCKHGLLAHITKCLRIYNGIKASYAFLQDERTNDLMVISLVLHDIGKIDEMHNGTYQKHSYVTHRVLGLEYIMGYKADITKVYDEDFFYMLCSVINQHHGDYEGEKPRTIYALVASMIDNIDATFTGIDDKIMNNNFVIEESGAIMNINDRNLAFFVSR